MTSATQARQQIGLSLEQAAQKARISPQYLRRVERGGHASYMLARRLAKLYQCPIDYFLYPQPGGETPKIQSTIGRSRKRPKAH